MMQGRHVAFSHVGGVNFMPKLDGGCLTYFIFHFYLDAHQLVSTSQRELNSPKR